MDLQGPFHIISQQTMNAQGVATDKNTFKVIEQLFITVFRQFCNDIIIMGTSVLLWKSRIITNGGIGESRYFTHRDFSSSLKPPKIHPLETLVVFRIRNEFLMACRRWMFITTRCLAKHFKICICKNMKPSSGTFLVSSTPVLPQGLKFIMNLELLKHHEKKQN